MRCGTLFQEKLFNFVAGKSITILWYKTKTIHIKYKDTTHYNNISVTSCKRHGHVPYKKNRDTDN